MRAAPCPAHEQARLNALRRYDILDTLPEIAFDELTRLTAQVCDTPIAVIAFVDEQRQWFKSKIGITATESPRSTAFCAWTILQNDVFVVENALGDERFLDNPWVINEPRIRFYAGVPLVSPDGHHLGTLSVYDHRARCLTPEQSDRLRILTRQVGTQLELRHRLVELARTVEEHQRIEERLRTSEAFYHTLVETLPQHILRKDRQGRFTFANHNFCRSLGKSPAELLGKTDYDLFPGDLAQKYHRDDQRVMETLQTLDTIEAHQTPSGEKLFVHVIKTPLYDADGHVVGIQGIFWDVTQRKKIEEALAYERDLLRALLDNIPDRVFIKDVHSRFLRCSRSLARQLGLQDPMGVVGRTDADFNAPEIAEEWRQEEQRILLTGRPLINKLEKQPDALGEQNWSAVTKAPIYSQSGSITGLIGIGRDITQLKQTEQALEQARDSALESARIKSEFLANVSHEIRTPMNAMTGMTGLLLDTPLSQEQREYVETIAHSTQALLAVINDILDFSKIEAGKLSFEVIDFQLRATVESTVEMLAERAQRKGLELVGCIAPDLPDHLRGDPGRLRQVLTNLIGNALKFTEQGEVVVRVSRRHETDHNVAVRFEVHDTGIGIDAHAIPIIFESFTQADGSTTRKYGGTGLGLTISKQLVELMNGEIGVDSVPGTGSVFWFHLVFDKPLRQPPPDAPAVSAGQRILVVDSHATSRQSLAQLLNYWKLETAEAKTREEALRLLRNTAASEKQFHLILVDSDPAGADGLALATIIQNESAQHAPPVVLMNTIGRRPTVAVLQQAGVAACLLKPVRQIRLQECLNHLLGGVGASAEVGTPLAEPAQERVAVPVNARVLVAEDNIVNQQLALKQLHKLGFAADAVSNGTQVLQALRRTHYDIVLMDCQMPEIDGYEVTRRVRLNELGPEGHLRPYIIALTANALEGDRERCLTAGMNDYLTKPLQSQTLHRSLERGLQFLASSPGPHPAQPAEQPLDPVIIAGLRDLQEEGQPDPLQQLIELFLRDARPRLDLIRRALISGDKAQASAAAHSLKGSASNLGARILARLSASLEQHVKAGETDQAQRLLPELEIAFTQVHQALQQLLNTPQS